MVAIESLNPLEVRRGILVTKPDNHNPREVITNEMKRGIYSFVKKKLVEKIYFSRSLLSLPSDRQWDSRKSFTNRNQTPLKRVIE